MPIEKKDFQPIILKTKNGSYDLALVCCNFFELALKNKLITVEVENNSKHYFFIFKDFNLKQFLYEFKFCPFCGTKKGTSCLQ